MKNFTTIFCISIASLFSLTYAADDSSSDEERALVPIATFDPGKFDAALTTLEQGIRGGTLNIDSIEPIRQILANLRPEDRGKAQERLAAKYTETAFAANLSEAKAVLEM